MIRNTFLKFKDNTLIWNEDVRVKYNIILSSRGYSSGDTGFKVKHLIKWCGWWWEIYI
jgi:hypothetical protein